MQVQILTKSRLNWNPSFLQEELSWSMDKVDELLLPIIQKMNRRGQVRTIIIFSSYELCMGSCMLSLTN